MVSKKIIFGLALMGGLGVGMSTGLSFYYHNKPRKIEQLQLDHDSTPDLVVTNNIGDKTVYFGLRHNDDFVTYHSVDELAEFQSAERIVELRELEQRFQR